jgi:hypothetical protein
MTHFTVNMFILKTIIFVKDVVCYILKSSIYSELKVRGFLARVGVLKIFDNSLLNLKQNK